MGLHLVLFSGKENQKKVKDSRCPSSDTWIWQKKKKTKLVTDQTLCPKRSGSCVKKKNESLNFVFKGDFWTRLFWTVTKKKNHCTQNRNKKSILQSPLSPCLHNMLKGRPSKVFQRNYLYKKILLSPTWTWVENIIKRSYESVSHLNDWSAQLLLLKIHRIYN